ncbi:hypothetical protein BTO30_11865 [Domibacillus antri]|uniref:Uncharacterized protein n=1 Tax=Domibacillus antri TaxID=1714264 RepID=A0A1Q8Q3U5_9BACI|nr:hypothetical protein BTO30_11865 [Domibacillus antri]
MIPPVISITAVKMTIRLTSLIMPAVDKLLIVSRSSSLSFKEMLFPAVYCAPAIVKHSQK